MRTLCSPSFYGRGYQQEGHIKAANWLAKTIKQLGLHPYEHFYLHPFRIPAIVTTETTPEVHLNGRKLKAGIEFQLHPCSNSGNFEWKQGSSGQGVAFVYERPPYLAVEVMEQYDTLGKPSAIVYIHPKLTFGVSTQRARVPVLEINSTFLKAPIHALSVKVKTGLLQNIVSYNVAGIIKGKDTTNTILIGAHYDHLGGYPGGTYYPGASDNASGVALWLSLAKYFAKKKNTPPCNLLFVAFGGEEIGLIGSAAFVQNNPYTVQNLACMLNLDIVGTGDAGITVVNGSIYPAHFQKLTQLNDSLKLLPKIFTRGRAPISDHHWFTEAGIPSLYLYTMSQKPTFYHQVQDTPASVSRSHFIPLGRLLVHFIRTF